MHYSEQRKPGYVPAPASITVRLENNRSVRILPESPVRSALYHEALKRRLAFEAAADPDRKSIVGAGCLLDYLIFGLVLDDERLSLEATIDDVPDLESLSPEEVAEWDRLLLDYARAVRRECEARDGRRLISFGEIQAIVGRALNVEEDIAAAKKR